MVETLKQKTETINEFEFTTKETITLEAPTQSQKVVITITKKHYYDPFKNKVITDQVVHKAKYRLNNKNEKKGEKI
jgi:hypothetical protein